MASLESVMKLMTGDAVLPVFSLPRITYHIHIYNTDGPNTGIAEIQGTDDPQLWAIIRENAQRMIDQLITSGEDVKIYDVRH